MLLEEIKFLVAGFKKEPLPLMCGLLIAVICYLWMDNSAIRERKEAVIEHCNNRIQKCESEKLAMQMQFGDKIDSIRRAELRKTEAQNAALQVLIDNLKSSNKRR